MASPRLDKLPAELLFEIARYLWLGDMSHLARVNRWLYQVLDPILYLTDAKPYNQYALFWAAEHNLLTVAERALRAGTPVQPHNVAPSPLRPFGRLFTEQELRAATDFSGPSTPLCIAAAAGHCATAALLLRDPRLMSSVSVKMAISSAAENDQAEMVDMLLRHLEHVDKESVPEMISGAFCIAFELQNIAVIQLLIDVGLRLVLIPSDECSYYQMNSAGTGHDELWDLFSSNRPLELVSDHHIERQHLRSNPQAIFIGKGSRGIVELVETFNSLGFDWKCKGELARMLRTALRRDNVPLVELLLSYSSDEQNELETLISFADFGVHPGPEACKWLLARGCGRDVWDQAFATALREQNIKEARLLLSIVEGIPADTLVRVAAQNGM
ncbi:Ankyrin repeat-containing domain protein [Beauveria brongniartii RCEF 3172]|uniref:Ankyrin repeat-containing domain protein n=1 Tax=Beauveria brongniartii RCEF 3172 TaxID=1081107 RepID=A0A167L7J7_9HYPO|nr:Ankyrin repeat-containing domain protein [Beauveria brongniartii RCEF 3172]